jgi:signal transduction histidine kinase
MQHSTAFGRTVDEIPRLADAWLWPARVIWWGMLLAYSAIFVVGIDPNIRQLSVACTPPACTYYGGLTGAQAAVLTGWGVSLQTYAVIFVALEVLIAVSFGGLGLLVYLKRGEERVAYGAALLIALTGIFLNPSTPPSAIAVYPWIGIVHLITHSVGFPAFFLVILTVPDGRFVPRWSRWIVPLACLVVWCAYTIPTLWPGSPQFATWLAEVSRLPASLFFFSALAVGVYGGVSRYRQGASDLQRQQLKWIALALAAYTVMPLSGLIAQLLNDGLDPHGQMIVALISVLGVRLGALGFVLCLSFAVLRYRLWDVDLVLRRVLVYGALSAAVVALYALVVGMVGMLFLRPEQPLVGFVGAVAVALLFQPLRSGLQRLVNRTIYGQRDQPDLVLAELGRQLESALSPELLVGRIEGTIRETLRLPTVAIRLAEAGSAPSIDPRLVALPLSYQGHSIGQLLVAPRPGESELTDRDRRLLEDLARQAGVALHAAGVTAELQRARERLVSTREEERRRLRRDLHDGLGPALAALVAQADAARDLVATQPERSAVLLEAIADQAEAATVDIRQLVYGLRPPALDDLGLLGAIRTQLAAYNEGDIQLTLCAPEALPHLPAAVEVAAYRIVQEAVTNVVRHAQARQCTIRIAVASELLVEVVDDGKGIGQATQAGVGLRSMRERAEELVGRLELAQTSGGGTTVRAVLPLATGVSHGEADDV